VWVDNATDEGIAIVLWLVRAVIAVALVWSWIWRRNNRRRVVRYEAWLEQQERHRTE
jgi:hypothetical protein